MLQPGRSGYSVSGGWATSSTSENGTPSQLQVSSRTGNATTLYQATELIDFVGEFQSGASDEFTAEIGSGSSSGGSGVGSGIAGGGYRYGFNGKEQDPEANGSGNRYDYGFRIYDPRIGKFLSVDPLTSSYPYYTPYQFAGNSPIWAIDLDGLEDYVVVKELYKSGATKKISIQYTVKKEDAKSTINMQFKQLLGKNVDGTDKLGTPLTDQKVVRILRDANKKEKVEYAEDLNKEEKGIKNQFSRNEMSNPTKDAWKLTVNGENYTSGVDRDEDDQQDKIATKNFHLIQNLKSSFSSASFYYASPTGEGSLVPKDVAMGINKKATQEFYGLPGKIKEDGGIKSINITLSYYAPSTVDDKDFAGLQKAFGQVANQVKEMYMKSGVKNVSVNPVIERRGDYAEANKRTPGVQITLKR